MSYVVLFVGNTMLNRIVTDRCIDFIVQIIKSRSTSLFIFGISIAESVEVYIFCFFFCCFYKNVIYFLSGALQNGQYFNNSEHSEQVNRCSHSKDASFTCAHRQIRQNICLNFLITFRIKKNCSSIRFFFF